MGACAQLVTRNTQNNLFLLIWSMRVGTQPLGVQPRYQRCKLPDFWPSNPVLWFAKAEFNFEVSGVATEIRVLLTEEMRANLKDLAVRADELFQHHWAAAVVMLDSTVAALAVKAGNKKSGGQSATGSGGASSSGGKSYFICDRHWRYGTKAFCCDTPKKCQ